MTALPAPYADDSGDLLTRTLTHLIRGSMVMPDGETVPLNIEGGTVSFDEARSPRVEANLTCTVPTDAALLTRMDPRTGARVVIDAGYRRPDGSSDIHPLVDLGLRKRPVSRPADTMAILARSDEALVIDASPGPWQAVTRASTTLAITALLTAVLPGVTPTVTAAAGPAIAQGPYDDHWDLILDFADRIDARVYDNGLRQWFVEATPTVGNVAHELAVGAGGTIEESEADLDREEWFNKVFLRYRWRDASDVDHTITSSRRITTGAFAATAPNVKTLFLERDNQATQAEADASAAALVKRTVTRGRGLTLSAVSAYWLRPGTTVLITLPTGQPEKHLVSAVTFDVKTGRMAVTTRVPDNTGTIGA